MKTLFKNGKIITKNSVYEGYLGIEDGKIIYINKKEPTDTYDEIIDTEGRYITPGFIEIHCHGGNNYDFMNADEETFFKVADFHSSHGVTSMLATSLSASDEEIKTFLNNFNEFAPKVKSLNYLGTHLEGPYFCMKYKGAQDPKYIRNPKKEEYSEYVKIGNLKRMSIAPEVPGAMELGNYLKENGIIAAIGHSEATFDCCREASENGYGLLTHYMNAMSTITKKNSYKTAGCIEAGLYFDELKLEVISDDRHVPNDLFKMVYKIKTRENIILISDALGVAGLPEGAKGIIGSKENGMEVVIDDGVAKLADKSAFAGSVASGDILIRNVYKNCGIELVDAVYMMTVTPAKLLGVFDRKGSIAVDKDADLVIFDDDINISSVYVNGEKVH